MRGFQGLLAFVLVVSLVPVGGAAAEMQWVGKLEEAKRLASEKDLDLYILLTGQGYCFHCELLKQEILAKDEFQQWASRRFILVRLESHDPDLLAPSVPTVILAGADGLPYGFLTGYASGTTVAKYLQSLERLLQVRDRRDEHLEKASMLSGKERAEALDRALAVVGPALGSLSERHDDPLLAFYGPQVEEITRLSGPDHALTKKYLARKSRRLEKRDSSNLISELNQLQRNCDHEGVQRFVDANLNENVDDETRFTLEFALQLVMEDKGEHEAALDNARRLLGTGKYSDRKRNALLDREMFNLFRLGRIDEMLDHFQRRIDLAKDDPSTKRRLLLIRSSQMMLQDPPDRTIALNREFRREVEPGTEYWFQASAFLAAALMRNEQFKDALSVLNEMLELRQDVTTIVQIARCQVELDQPDAARSKLEQAKGQLEKLREGDAMQRRMAEAAQTQISEIENRLEAGPKEESLRKQE